MPIELPVTLRSALVSAALSESQERQHPTPIGAIIFGKDQNNVLIFAASKKSVYATSLPDNEEAQPVKSFIMSTPSRRIIRLPQYEDILPVVVDVGSKELVAQRSIMSTENPLALTLYYKIAGTETEDVYHIEELQLLQMVVGRGKCGGLIVFSEGGMPDEYALAIELLDAPEGKKAALLAFIHPQLPDDKMQSINGVSALFTQINREYREHIELGKNIVDALDRIDLLYGQKKIKDSGPRVEIFKTVLIAFSRLAALTKDKAEKKKYENMVKKYLDIINRSRLPAFNPSALRRLIDESVMLAVMGNCQPEKPAGKKPTTELQGADDPIFPKLHTEECIELYLQVFNQLKEIGGFNCDCEVLYNKQLLYSYLLSLLSLLTKAKSNQQLADLKTLFEMLRNKPFYEDCSMPAFSSTNDRDDSEIINPGSYYSSISSNQYYDKKHIYVSAVVETALQNIARLQMEAIQNSP